MLIQAQFPRDCVGEHVSSGWVRLIPLVHHEKITGRYPYSLPTGNLLSQKVGKVNLLPRKKVLIFKGKEVTVQAQFFEDDQKAVLHTILTRDIGLGSGLSKILSDRRISDFKRIQDFISGIIDSLWLAEEKIFLNPSRDLTLIKKLIRKIFAVGAFNRVQLMDMWKEFTNYLFHKCARTTTIGGAPAKPGKENIFHAWLPRLEMLSHLFSGEVLDNNGYCQLAHLTSTRQMPYMGLPVEKRAKQAFEEVLTSTEGMATAGHVAKMRLAAARIGRICRNLNRKRPILDATAHISVSSSGEIDFSIRDGGIAAAVRSAMVRILTRIPERSEVENTPFGPWETLAGIPVWKTGFRSLKQRELVLPEEFLTERPLVKDQPGRFWGLDSVLGKQLMYVAWKELEKLPTIRQEVVPEMGNKARVITVSAYWLNILQAPLAHLLIEALRFHPSVFSSFTRQDQAWAATEMLHKANYNPDRHWVLSSDLKDATNAQQFELTKTLIRGFLQGYDSIYDTAYVELVLGTIGPRLVVSSNPEELSFVTSKGIMMGEAIAKPSLTLLNLSIEELSFLEYTQAEESLYTNAASPYRSWRCCHIGGDDHLATGPLRYLETITNNHLLSGSHISAGKHGYSQFAVKYTEKVLNIRNLANKQPLNGGDLSKSIIIDSVKVRLLERGQSTMLKKDDKNVAIGKAQQLARTLQWLPSYCYRPGKIQSIRNLFIKRMGNLLPREHKNPRAFAAIHLPNILGGYGLGGENYKEYFMKSPWPHRCLLSKMLTGIDCRQELRILRNLNTNLSTRGVKAIADFEAELCSFISDRASAFGCKTWPEFRKMFPDDNSRVAIANGFRAGWMSVQDFAKQATRGTLFQHLLMGTAKAKEFQTTPWVQTYAKFYETFKAMVEPYGEPDWENLTDKHIRTIVESANKVWYIDSRQIETFDLGVGDNSPQEPEIYDFVDAELLTGFRIGMPDLSVGKHFVGWKGKKRDTFIDHFENEFDYESFQDSFIQNLVANRGGQTSQMTSRNDLSADGGLRR